MKTAIFTILLALALPAWAGDGLVELGVGDTAFRGDLEAARDAEAYSIAASLPFAGDWSFALDGRYSDQDREDGVEVKDFAMGVRRSFGAFLEPYVGLGVAYVELEAGDYEESAPCGWGQVGLRFNLTDAWTVGADARYLIGLGHLDPGGPRLELRTYSVTAGVRF